jgi:hypothetical protein
VAVGVGKGDQFGHEIGRALVPRGRILLHEPLTPQLAAGAALALTGVGMIAARPNAALRKLIGLFREWTA